MHHKRKRAQLRPMWSLQFPVPTAGRFGSSTTGSVSPKSAIVLSLQSESDPANASRALCELRAVHIAPVHK